MLSAECSFSNSRFSCFPSNTLSNFNISLSIPIPWNIKESSVWPRDCTGAQELGEVAASRVDELRQAAVDKANELGSQVRTGYYRARLRANAVVRDYPLHVVLAVGAAGFLLGLGLRIWRASREY